MPATKSSFTVKASATNTAGSTTSGTELDLSTAYRAGLVARITNGATGPTVGCDFVVYVGDATGVKREFSRQTAPVTNSAVTDFVVDLPDWAMFVNVDFVGNTGQSVTVECYAQRTTGI